ncbi:MAG: Rid family hydrolase [Pseudomonadota bacterium]
MIRLAGILAGPAAVFALATGAQAEPKQTIMPEKPEDRTFFDQFGFSEATIHNGTVYLSGIIVGPPREGMTEEEVYDRTFAYIAKILARAGSSWDDVIDMTTYHVDIDQSMPVLSAVKNRYVKAPFPAWTAIDIDRLFSPDGRVEIKITARVTPKEEGE